MTPPILIERKGVTCELWCGDCLEIIPNLRSVDAVITDPPFGIGFASQPTTGGRMRGQRKEDWDDHPADVGWIIKLDPPKIVIWGGNYFSLPISRGWLSWFKPDAPPSMSHFELAWTNQDQNSRQICHSIAATNAERVGHPTQKPYRVMSWTMDQVGVSDAALVLDPYMGSGTTGIACLKTGRNFIGIEKDPKYFQIAVDRIQREAAQGVLI